MVGRARGRGRGAQNTNPPVVVTPVLPVPPAATPALNAPAAATRYGDAASRLNHPLRQHRLPARFRQDDGHTELALGDSEYIDINNVADYDSEEDDPAPTRVAGARVHPTPLQTATDTTRSDPLATGGRATRSKSAADVHNFFDKLPDGKKACKVCV
jgi:hypothetical protein